MKSIIYSQAIVAISTSQSALFHAKWEFSIELKHTILKIWTFPEMLYLQVHSEKSPARPMLFYSTNYWHQF